MIRNPGTLPPISPIERATIRDIAWAAGIFEGEGHARPNHAGAVVLVSQKDLWILIRLRALFGGSLYDYRGRMDRTASRWQITGPRARGFLMTIYSLLSPRRKEQARKALGVSN